MRPNPSSSPALALARVSALIPGLVLLGLAGVPALDFPALWEALSPLVARLHPALVHFPIGLLVVAGVLDLLAAMFGREARSPAVKTCLFLGLLGAGAAAGSGWVYAELDPPGRLLEETLFYHRWVGIAAVSSAALSWLLYLMSRGGERSGPRRLSRVVLFACLILVSVGGHLGGEMVHGDDFLADPWAGLMAHLGGESETGVEAATEPGAGVGEPAMLPDIATPEAPALADPAAAEAAEGAALFLSEVWPVLSQRCFECHGSKKQKAGLRLDQADGGLFGDAGLIDPGSPANSVLVQRISLPADGLDIMPAKGEPLSAEQIDSIRRWVRAGAPWPEG